MTSFFDNRIPLSRIHQFNDFSANLKTNIIISHQKLPKDFFPAKNTIKREFSNFKDRGSLLSQNIRRNFSNLDDLQSPTKR